ncbi:MAG: hypothetical protein ACRDU5_07690 [Mycobacterium sp.]
MAISDEDLERLGRCAELAIAPGAVVDGPAATLADAVKSLYGAKYRP